MYRYIQGSVTTADTPGDWQPIALDKLTFLEIFERYTGALAELEVVELGKRYSLNLWDLNTSLRILPVTFGDWLVSIGNQTIPISEDAPDTSRHYATYRDIWSYGFQVQAYNRYISSDQVLTLDQVVDALVTKKDVDYTEMDKYSLFIVNGLVCNSAATKEGIVICSAGRGLRNSKDNRIGVINFEEVGAVKRYPITDEMLMKPNESLPYKDAVYLRLTDVDVGDKTIGLVIGGYLHLLDGQYERVANRILKVKFSNYPLVERYWTLKQNGDASKIKLTEFENRKDKLDFKELESDENIAALMTSEQSFIVTIDCVGLGVKETQAHQAELAGRYYAYTRPMHPLISNTGRFINYTSYAGKHNYVIRTSNYFYYNYMRRTTEFRKQEVVTQHCVTLNPKIYQDAYWLEIFRNGTI